ncbi:hypothetical protein FJ970_09035 [Mesorhizobium sp. B2-1-8]|uniref:hypothetical protein n=1 Tax=Mesorhizobium sp. B2-1-8 TaxID=2589967 RepID=UPI001126B640|nr:hypothetical protein [Mesorhizobium sp. B2-1-8]UCI21075.1 hypothetical protein FJ970_09035 [Mesorhizobium sp. B2-1-8]
MRTVEALLLSYLLAIPAHAADMLKDTITCKCGPETFDWSTIRTIYEKKSSNGGGYDDPAPMDGLCRFQAQLFNEQHCTSGALCFPKIKLKATKDLQVVGVRAKPECRSSLFKPHPNPFVRVRLGPYRPGDNVDQMWGGLFGDNAKDFTVLVLTYLKISRYPAGTDGFKFEGRVPKGTVPATYYGQIEATNKNGSAVMDFQMEVTGP